MQPQAAPRLIAGRYRLGQALGHGAVGHVYAGEDLRLERPVAIKLLRHEMATSTTARRRFEEEARAAARISHPHVVSVFDFGEHDDTPYIVMERLPGTTLADELRAGPLDIHRACHIARQVLAALAEAHGHGVLHRDIKPGNVLLTESGDAKVADFGIAKAVERVDLTVPGALLGTPAYLAPERVAGAPATPASDVYSVGVLLYEALAGVKPFVGDRPVAVVHAVQYATPVPLEEHRAGVPAEVVAAVARSMARDPAERFPTAPAMAAALGPGESTASPAVRHRSTIDTPTRVDEPTEVQPRPRLDEDTTAAQAQLTAAGARRSWRARSQRVAVLAIAAAVAVMAAIGLRDPGGGTTAPASDSSTTATSVAPDLDDALDELEEAVRP